MTDGRVPRHKERIGAVWERMERRVGRRALCGDCCTRVFRRSAGWRRTAERVPVERPARKWKAEERSQRCFVSAALDILEDKFPVPMELRGEMQSKSSQAMGTAYMMGGLMSGHLTCLSCYDFR